jgi:hypothetical protein
MPWGRSPMSKNTGAPSYPGGPCMRNARHSHNGVNPAIICNAGVRTHVGWHLRIAGFRAMWRKALGDVGRSNSGPSGLGSGHPYGVWAWKKQA